MNDATGGLAPAIPDRRPVVVLLCTGNAARSVMAGAMLAADGEPSEGPVRLVTAGTHVVEGQPMSRRTRAALEAVGVSAPLHRSHQLSPADVEAATVIVAMAGDHVGYVRRTFPEAAAKTSTIKRLCRDLGGDTTPLTERVRALGLAAVDVEPWEDVDDPAGGDDEDYVACAKQLYELCTDLAPRLF
jgi:protein-tyrosine-phosphatase